MAFFQPQAGAFPFVSGLVTQKGIDFIVLTDAEKFKVVNAEIDRLFDQLDELADEAIAAHEKDNSQDVRRLIHMMAFDLQNALIERVREIDPAIAEELAETLSDGRA